MGPWRQRSGGKILRIKDVLIIFIKRVYLKVIISIRIIALFQPIKKQFAGSSGRARAT
jgi:hypothetical protein